MPVDEIRSIIPNPESEEPKVELSAYQREFLEYQAKLRLEERNRLNEIVRENISISYTDDGGMENIWEPQSLDEVLEAPELSMVLWAAHLVNLESKANNPRERDDYYNLKATLLSHVTQQWKSSYPNMRYGSGYDLRASSSRRASTALFDCPGIGQLSFHYSVVGSYPYEYTGVANSWLRFSLPRKNLPDDYKAKITAEAIRTVGIDWHQRGREHNFLVSNGIDPKVLYSRTTTNY